ncbi:MAG: family 20 glycosylhydrolase, partial [Clostridia bacterium]|nr:family 20 glycosylhydrolase [Clostridia bacterium]
KIDIRAEDQRPEKLYPHCYCPSNERSYEILFDLADEIIEVFQPKEYVHFGHDEVYEIGVCKVCREKDPAELFAADVNRLYDYLKKKGLKMMIWADMLQRPERYRTTAAIDKIPKDILMLDFIWYFYMDRDIETNLLEHGFKVAIGNLYSSHFPRYCSRIARKGMVGGQISAWVGTDLRSLVQEGKLFDFFLTAQMLWSKDYNPCCTHAYDRQITARMPWLKNKLEGIALPSHAEKAKRRLLLEQPLADAPVKELALEGEAKSILLCHTLLYHVTKKPWKAPSKVGEYLLTFADGTEQRIPLTAGGNIGHWNRYQHQPNLHELYRHTGYSTIYDCEGIHSKTPAGEPICLYQIEVLTEKPLRSVRLIEEPDAQIALCRIEVVT